MDSWIRSAEEQNGGHCGVTLDYFWRECSLFAALLFRDEICAKETLTQKRTKGKDSPLLREVVFLEWKS